ncbi:MAG: C40 family peptidase [Verrucomicrobiaceae bacterium]|nr:C40 family peptidase [Verrucomicrobiaceae bacterium]
MTPISHFRVIAAAAALAIHCAADVPSPEAKPPRAEVSSLAPDELKEFATLPPGVKALITRALDFTRKNLTYRFGSSDPALGGMDCSGTIYRLLQDHGIKDAPRQSDEMAVWVRDKTVLHETQAATALEDEKFRTLSPGDLLFWTGTYEPSARKLPVSHVMLYLGRCAKDGRPVIFGASDGRSYEGQRRCGVSVFDFKIPKPGDKARLLGYGPVPGLLREEVRKAAR